MKRFHRHFLLSLIAILLLLQTASAHYIVQKRNGIQSLFITTKASSLQPSGSTLPVMLHADYKPVSDSLKTIEKVKRKSVWSKWLGIGSLISLLLGPIRYLSIPAAIIAIVFGNSVKRNSDDKAALQNGKTGVLFGWITIGTIVIAVIVAILIALLVVSFFRLFFH